MFQFGKGICKSSQCRLFVQLNTLWATHLGLSRTYACPGFLAVYVSKATRNEIFVLNCRNALPECLRRHNWSIYQEVYPATRPTPPFGTHRFRSSPSPKRHFILNPFPEPVFVSLPLRTFVMLFISHIYHWEIALAKRKTHKTKAKTKAKTKRKTLPTA